MDETSVAMDIAKRKISTWVLTAVRRGRQWAEFWKRAFPVELFGIFHYCRAKRVQRVEFAQNSAQRHGNRITAY